MFISDAAQGIKQFLVDSWLFCCIKPGLNEVKKALCSVQTFSNAFTVFTVVDAHAFHA